MTLQYWGALVAAIGALAHCYFAYLETVKWGSATVRKIAPAWVEGLKDQSLADAHIVWASRLAFNVGAYNLLLAAGLAWTCVAYLTSEPMADALAVFFAVWLLAAAAAARYTRVIKAFILQGLLGLALLAAPVLAA